MQLTDEQKAKVSTWIQEGAKLSEIQDRLGKEFDVRLTYMDARLLVDDLKLTPKDPEPPHPPAPAPAPAEAPGVKPAPVSPLEEPTLPGAGGKVDVTVDQLTRPGAMASGKVGFSDGQKAEWQLDQYGRLALTGSQPGYRPPASDVAEFQAALERELAKLGM